MDSTQLIIQAKNGDIAAYSILITNYSPIVERFAYQMGNPIHEIPDITQEVFIRMYRFIDGFSQAKFTTWLYKITLNVSRDFKRKENLHNQKINIIKSERDINSISPQESVLRAEEDQLLHECIGELDEKYQIPIILFYFHEKKYEEMAEILTINLSTLKTRLLRGKSLLKKALEEVERKEGERNG